MLAINTIEGDVTIEKNPCELIPCEYQTGGFYSKPQIEEEREKVNDPDERVREVKNLLDVSQLNEEKKNQIR